jgi:hypothetical protein
MKMSDTINFPSVESIIDDIWKGVYSLLDSVEGKEDPGLWEQALFVMCREKLLAAGALAWDVFGDSKKFEEYHDPLCGLMEEIDEFIAEHYDTEETQLTLTVKKLKQKPGAFE